MPAYVFRRLAAAIPILIGISIISFIVIMLPTYSQTARVDHAELLRVSLLTGFGYWVCEIKHSEHQSQNPA
jgi:ABC-type microcin C transport system permease subunit YejB